MKKYKSTSYLNFNSFKVIKSIFISQYAIMNEYRAEIILWAISGILPLIMLSIWISVDYIGISGLDIDQLRKYFISAFIVRQFTAVWVMVTFEEDLIEGNLSSFLLQPFPVMIRYILSHIAEQFTRLPFVCFMLISLFSLWPSSFWKPNISSFIIALIAIFLGFILRFLLHWCFCMLCFWVERASSIERLLLIPYIFLSGLVAPLEAFPESITGFIMYTPFPYFLAFPSQILSGQNVNLFNGFTISIMWSFSLLVISTIFWRKGVKHYSAMGS